MKKKCHALLSSKTYGVLTIVHKMKNSRNKRNILFLRQGIEEVFIDDLSKAHTKTGNVYK